MDTKDWMRKIMEAARDAGILFRLFPIPAEVGKVKHVFALGLIMAEDLDKVFGQIDNSVFSCFGSRVLPSVNDLDFAFIQVHIGGF